MRQLLTDLKPSLLIFIFLFITNVRGQNIVINEIMASNGFTIQDEDGDYEDWVELYNADSIDIDLANYYITDDPSRPSRWQFPSVIVKPGEFLLVFTSGKNRKSGPFLHTNFSISAAGEPIILYYPNHSVADQIPAIAIPRDVSYGRMPDGGQDLEFFTIPTPGFSNLFSIPPIPKIPLIADKNSGFYPSEFAIKILNDFDSTVSIYYTLDGNNPDTSSFKFQDSLLIYDRTVDSNSISLIRTNSERVANWLQWLTPSDNLYKGTTLKIQAYIGDSAVSDILHRTFFIDSTASNKYSLPVFSISIPPDAFFNYDTGIYVPGKKDENTPDLLWDYAPGNYSNQGRAWERVGHVVFLDTQGSVGFEQSIGVRIHGGGSRALPIKTLRLNARPEYGKSEINFKFFEDSDITSFKTLLLRNAGQDFAGTYFLDALTQEIIKPLNVDLQNYTPSIVFVNGEYWGIHNVRERIDKHFVASHHPVNPDNLDMIAYNIIIEKEEGNYEFFQSNIINYIDANIDRLNEPSVYNYLSQVIDFDNYLDYMTSKMFFGVLDWMGNNVRFWRERRNGSKFRWISFDNDDALQNLYLNSLELATLEGYDQWPNPDYATHLFRNLLKNDRFKDSFLTRFEKNLRNTFGLNRIDSITQVFKNRIEPEMAEHIVRWGYPSSFEEWNKSVDTLLEKFKIRTSYIKNMLFEFFEIDDENYLDFITDYTGLPEIKRTKNILIFPNPNTGNFNVTIPIDLSDSNDEILSIHSISGREVMKSDAKSLNFNSNNTATIDIRGLSSGIYIIKFTNGKEVLTSKLSIY